MTTRFRKTKRKNLAESNSNDDSDAKTRKSCMNKDKKKYCKNIDDLSDTDISNNKESTNFYKSALSSRLSKGTKVKANHTMQNLDMSNSSNSDSSHSKKSSTTKKKRKDVPSESSSASSEQSKNSSSSIEFQEPKPKRKNNLQESFEKYEFNDYSNITTPSRINEGNICVDSAQEISFKHYVIEEIKKFQKVNSKLNDDLKFYNSYLLKKKISSVGDAKFFVHKILEIYKDTFMTFKDNRRQFVSIYENWMSELGKKPKEVEKERCFSLSSDESDNKLETSNDKKVLVNKLTKNGKSAETVSSQKKRNQPNVHEAEASDDSTDDMLARVRAKVEETSAALQGPSSSNKTTNNEEVFEVSEDSDKPSLKDQDRKELKSKNKSVASTKASEESEVGTPMQDLGHNSDAIFSSQESKSKKRNKDEKEKTEMKEKVGAEKSPVAALLATVPSLSSDSEDIFDTSTGEVANTPVCAKSTTVPRTSSDNEAANEVAKIAEVDEPPSVSAAAVESSESKEVTDPKERAALNELKRLINDDSDSDFNADSEPEEAEAEAKKELAAASSSAKSSKGEANRERKKIFTKQSKKRSLICSDSSSSNDGESARSKRRSRNKSADGAAASLRTAPVPRKKDAFELHSNRYYLADEKLRRKCQVELEPLPESELAKHARALAKSKDYVERKKIQRYYAQDRKKTIFQLEL